MQPVGAIHNLASDVGHHGFLNRSDFGDDRRDAALGHALICARAHPAAQERLAVGNGFCHLHIAILRDGAKAMRLTRLIIFVWLIGKVRVAELVARTCWNALTWINPSGLRPTLGVRTFARMTKSGSMMNRPRMSTPASSSYTP
jgi:hypothetical protein